jgi:hypothetical protein
VSLTPVGAPSVWSVILFVGISGDDPFAVTGIQCLKKEEQIEEGANRESWGCWCRILWGSFQGSLQDAASPGWSGLACRRLGDGGGERLDLRRQGCRRDGFRRDRWGRLGKGEGRLAASDAAS